MNEDRDHERVCAAIAKHLPGHDAINRPSNIAIIRVWHAYKGCLALEVYWSGEWYAEARVVSKMAGGTLDTSSLETDGKLPKTVFEADDVETAVRGSLRALRYYLDQMQRSAVAVAVTSALAMAQIEPWPSDSGPSKEHQP